MANDIVLPPRGQFEPSTSLTLNQATEVLRKYWHDNSAVWDLFEQPLDHARNEFEPMDITALNALNARMTMSDMTSFWSDPRRTGQWEQLLRAVPGGDVTEMSESERTDAARALGALADSIHTVSDWSNTRIGKLLYRMRPGLAPIYDKVVGDYYRYRPEWKTWHEWYELVMGQVTEQADGLRQAVAGLDERYRRISPIRAWDILLWSAAL